ncbi:MAG: hypothetical protein IKZ48_07575 [Prevotella sp.]|nr:hypothetical protein [Prevotella sp.]
MKEIINRNNWLHTLMRRALLVLPIAMTSTIDAWAQKPDMQHASEASPIEYNLAEGWNWISTSIESEALPFIEPILDKTDRLVGQTNELIKDEVYGMVGGLQTMDVTAGYKIHTTAQASMKKTGITASISTPVRIHKGWNWIGYLPMQSMAVGEALKRLSAATGDRLINGNSFAEYGANGWEGTLSVMNPGQGFLYHRTGASTTLRYPSETNSIYASQDDHTSECLSRGNSTLWHYDPHLYPDVTTIVAQLYLEEQCVDQNEYIVGAFCGNECRGMGQVVGNKLFITVHGTISDGDAISFCAYENATTLTLPIDETICFQGQCLGTLDSPMPLHAQSVVVSIDKPTSQSEIRTIYSADGKRLRLLHRGMNIVRMNNGTTTKVIVK